MATLEDEIRSVLVESAESTPVDVNKMWHEHRRSRRGDPRRGLALAAAAAVALTAAGGLAVHAVSSPGAVSPAGSSEPALGPVPAITTSKQITSPLSAYELSLDQQRTVSAAMIAVERQCSERFGVKSTLPPPPFSDWDGPVYGPVSVLATMTSSYGVFDPAEVSTRGYAGPAPTTLNSKSLPGAWNPSLRELQILRGTEDGSDSGSPLVNPPKDPNGSTFPPGGCAAQGGPAIPGLEALNLNLPGQIADKAQQLWRVDTRVRSAERAWVSCMSKAGFAATTRQSIAAATATKAIRLQIPTARADATCAQQTNLVGIEYAADVAYQNMLIADHADEFAILAQTKATVLRGAAQILDKS